MKTRVVLQISAVGCAVSVLAFLGIVAIFAPFNFADLVHEIMAGKVVPGTDIYNQYVAVIPLLYTVDDVFIIGWIVGWVGVTMLVSKRNHLLGSIVLAIGIVVPILDFLENEISWTLIDISRSSIQIPLGWYIAWRIVRQVGYVVFYAVAALTGISLWSRKILGRVAAGLGTVGVVIALAGMYMPALFVIGQLWWLAWFITLGLLLWQESKNWEQGKSET